MPRKPAIILGLFLILSLLWVIAYKALLEKNPVLTIVSTSFPGCKSRTLVITRSSLAVFKENRAASRLRIDRLSAEPILNAISNAPVTTLKSVYEDQDIMDGFELEFRFHDQGDTKSICLRNWYVPELYAILDECNKILPPAAQFAHKQFFVEQNSQIQQLIANYMVDPTLQPIARERIVAGLKRKIVKLAE